MLYHKYPRTKVSKQEKNRLKKSCIIQFICLLVFTVFLILILENNYIVFKEEELLYSEGTCISIEEVQKPFRLSRAAPDTYYLLKFDDGNTYYIKPRDAKFFQYIDFKNSEKPIYIKYLPKTQHGGHILANLSDGENTYFSMDEVNHQTKTVWIGFSLLFIGFIVVWIVFNIVLFNMKYAFKKNKQIR